MSYGGTVITCLMSHVAFVWATSGTTVLDFHSLSDVSPSPPPPLNEALH